MRYLFDQSEPVIVESDAVICRHPQLSDGVTVARLHAGESAGTLPPGHYLITETRAPGDNRTRYLGVVGDSCTVVQLAIGAFTSDTFDAPVHGNRIPANYYVGASMLGDTTFRGYEQDYGDAIVPHVMPNQLEAVDPSFRNSSANWESLDADAIAYRLRKLDEYWRNLGFAPLRGFATYTPSNSLVAAMKKIGWNVLHSLVPEQNWSDGHWAINHWGMPNQPFYISDDDFRKPTVRGERNVIGMSMDSYHLYLPHVVGFGDFVLSPSHFLRWNRTVESGAYPERFRNFLIDYLAAATRSNAPFFLIAGFEFGRSFGVRSMTRHNRAGIEILIELSKTMPIVFATCHDVAAYYEKFNARNPEAVFTQRDYQTGTRMMDKPIDAGPSIGLEMNDFKAVFAQLDPLPFYHYDYLRPWSFRAADTSAPEDFAEFDHRAVRLDFTPDSVKIQVSEPLPRATPVALWDCRPGVELEEFRYEYPPVLDDRRTHSVVILPAGFSGSAVQPLTRVSEPPAAEFSGLTHPLWRVQTIGAEAHRQCYLFLNLRLLAPVQIEYRVPGDCWIDSPEKPLGHFRKGDMVRLEFSSRRTWYRFYGLTAAELQPAPENLPALVAAAETTRAFFENGEASLARAHAELDAWFAGQIVRGEKTVLEVDCFGNNLFGERSRAVKFDRWLTRAVPELDAREYCDGGISLGYGCSGWVHPRGMHALVTGLDKLPAPKGGVFHLYLFSRTPPGAATAHSYWVTLDSGTGFSWKSDSPWVCPPNLTSGAVLRIDVPAEKLRNGELSLGLRCAQRGVLDDWFAEHGYHAVLERLAITVSE